MSVNIGKRKIGRNYPPFIIAEMSANHNQSLEHALKIVDAAAKAGAHAIRLQTYTADTMTIDADNARSLLMIRIAYGMESHFIISIKRHTLPGNGISRSLITVISWV